MSRDPYKLYPHDYALRAVVLPFIPLAVTPNHVTALRFFLIPFVAFFLWRGAYDVGIPLFLFTALTDAVDGSLARVRRCITPWGTFYDPVADKVLITVVVLIMVMKHINVWFGLLMLLVEALIAVSALWRRSRGQNVSGANVWGKTKMFLQVVGVTLLMIAVWFGLDLFIPFSVGTLGLAIAFAVISLYTYGI